MKNFSLVAILEALTAGIAMGATVYGTTHSIEGAIIAGIGAVSTKLMPNTVTTTTKP